MITTICRFLSSQHTGLAHFLCRHMGNGLQDHFHVAINIKPTPLECQIFLCQMGNQGYECLTQSHLHLNFDMNSCENA